MKRYVFTGEVGNFPDGREGRLVRNDERPIAINRTEYVEYADIQYLQAERDRLSDRSKADDALIERLTTALRLATDDRDRLRAALCVIEALSDYEASDGGAQTIARRALEGEKV